MMTLDHEHDPARESAVAYPGKVQGKPVVSTCIAGGTNRALTRGVGFVRHLETIAGSGSRVWAREPLSRRTTLRVGGPADVLVQPADETALSRLLRFSRAEGVPVFLLGRGSNLIVRDGGIPGLVVHLGEAEFGRIERVGAGLEVGAGARLKDVAHAARRAGLGGLEFLEGIPGNLGGALRMNAGAMGTCTFEHVVSVRAMTRCGERVEQAVAGIPVEYRSCPMFREHVALGARLEGVDADAVSIADRMGVMNRRRWETQPSQPSAGCTFKNPSVERPAGRLIEAAGLKGERIGGAMVSDVHANFIVNLGEATAADVLSLIERVRQRVWDQAGVRLETEVEIVGVDPVGCV